MRGTRKTKRGGARNRVAFALVAALAGLATISFGCDQLGNPPRESTTEWLSWSDERAELETRARTLPAARSNELLDSVEGGRADHFDREASPGEMVSLVTVKAVWRRPSPSRKVAVTTLFRFRDGGELERQWMADPERPTWYAGFAIPSLPESAVSFLSP